MLKKHKPTLLIFPINIASAKPIIRFASMMGIRVVGATSINNYMAPNDGVPCINLPYVTAADFESRLMEVLETYSIDLIWTPHHAVWSYLSSASKDNPRLNEVLCGDHPFTSNWNLFRESDEWGRRMQCDRFAEQVAPVNSALRPSLSAVEYASIHRGFLRIPGETDLDKLETLCAIARIAPEGDVVEIGSLYGRSAYALGRLAGAYGIGSCIAIDPWAMASAEDQGEQAQILRLGLPFIDLEHVFAEFLATAAEVPGMSYIRLPSDIAIREYSECARRRLLAASELPPISVKGKISILHIDGNHRLDEVRRDLVTWIPRVVSGGWVLVDDYVWSFGDGPKIAGDELLKSEMFDCSFCAGDTLFLRIRAD